MTIAEGVGKGSGSVGEQVDVKGRMGIKSILSCEVEVDGAGAEGGGGVVEEAGSCSK